MKNKSRILEDLYHRYNRREFISPDPLEYLHQYHDPYDREIVGLVASVLAYGNVKQILKSVALVLGILGNSPRNFIQKTNSEKIFFLFKNFRHRWHTGEDMAAMLTGVKKIIEIEGSLKNLFLKHCKESDENIAFPLESFIQHLKKQSPPFRKNLLPLPSEGSACKRLLMYLRWMVRCDDVDVGDWAEISASRLIIPLDTHMFRMSRRLGFTRRKQANWETALEVTRHFKKIRPSDPVRYDFVLTRSGIWGEKIF